MVLDVNNYVQSCALFHCPHSLSQSRLCGEIQYVCGYETLDLLGVTGTGVKSRIHTDKAGRKQRIRTVIRVPWAERLHLGKVGSEYCLHCKWHITFSFCLLPLFWLLTAASRWCHRLASAKCSSSFEWLGKAQTLKVSHLTLCVSVLYVLLTMITCQINLCV